MNMNSTTNSINSVCTATSAVFTAIQVDDVMRWISLGITILCGIVTLITGIANWYSKATKDGKITTKEVLDLTNKTKSQLEEMKDEINKALEDTKDGSND